MNISHPKSQDGVGRPDLSVHNRPLANVTVVIPCYNSSATLLRALQSVTSQTWQPREIIVVDDASTRHEKTSIRLLANATPRCRCIALPSNCGPGEARNAGWDAASSAWVAFLDSDDAWHPQKLEYQCAAIEQATPAPSLVACRAVELDAASQFAYWKIPPTPHLRTVSRRDLLLRNQFSTSSVLLRRDLPVRFPPKRRYAEDYELWLVLSGMKAGLVAVQAELVARFKSVYGASGLSASTWRMIAGEYTAFLRAHKAGAIKTIELPLTLAVATARASRRLMLLACKRLRLTLPKKSRRRFSIVAPLRRPSLRCQGWKAR